MTAQLSFMASATASASSTVPGMMKGTRGISPKNAASVDTGTKGKPLLASTVALAAWQCMTASASGFTR